MDQASHHSRTEFGHFILTQDDTGKEDDQFLVENLFDVTPSSSVDPYEWRDGFIYDDEQTPDAFTPPAFLSLNRTQPAQTNIETGYFEKEAVPTVSRQSSTLSSLLQSRLGSEEKKRSKSESDFTKLTVQNDSIQNATLLGACTVNQVISSILRKCSPSSDRPLIVLNQNVENFELRVADDDGTPDLDFPELDRTVVITSVGVENFVLCTRDTVNVIMFIHIISKLDSAIQIEFSLPKQTRESDSELSEGQEPRQSIRSRSAEAAMQSPGSYFPEDHELLDVWAWGRAIMRSGILRPKETCGWNIKPDQEKALVDIQDTQNVQGSGLVFSGNSFVDWLVKKKHCNSRREALMLGQSLLEAKVFYAIADDRENKDAKAKNERKGSIDDSDVQDNTRFWISGQLYELCDLRALQKPLVPVPSPPTTTPLTNMASTQPESQDKLSDKSNDSIECEENEKTLPTDVRVMAVMRNVAQWLRPWGGDAFGGEQERKQTTENENLWKLQESKKKDTKTKERESPQDRFLQDQLDEEELAFEFKNLDTGDTFTIADYDKYVPKQ